MNSLIFGITIMFIGLVLNADENDFIERVVCEGNCREIVYNDTRKQFWNRICNNPAKYDFDTCLTIVKQDLEDKVKLTDEMRACLNNIMKKDCESLENEKCCICLIVGGDLYVNKLLTITKAFRKCAKKE